MNARRWALNEKFDRIEQTLTAVTGDKVEGTRDLEHK